MRSSQHPITSIPSANEQILTYWTKYNPLSGTRFFDFYEDFKTIAEHLKHLPSVSSVTEIGCSNGIQSLFFQDYKYIGIDITSPYGLGSGDSLDLQSIPFFKQGEDNTNYYVAQFPGELSSEMVGDVFVSNMSVGYGALRGIDDRKLQEAFNRFRCGYGRVPNRILNLLQKIFPVCVPLSESELRNSPALYFFSK
jgi:hypothetical protein